MDGMMVKTALPPETTVAMPGVMVPPTLFVTDDVILNVWSIERVTVTVCVMPPPMPVTVSGNVPEVDDALALIVRVELPEFGAVIDAGLNVAVAPDGRPDAESETTLLKFPEAVVLTVVATIEP